MSPDSPQPAPEVVDLREAKAGAQRLFPAGHPLREALCREPDVLPRSEAQARVGVYLRWAWACRG